jgi:hypothetical protein
MRLGRLKRHLPRIGCHRRVRECFTMPTCPIVNLVVAKYRFALGALDTLLDPMIELGHTLMFHEQASFPLS